MVLKRPESQHQPGRRNRAHLLKDTKMSGADEAKSTTQVSSIVDLNQQMTASQLFPNSKEQTKAPGQSKQPGQPADYQHVNQKIFVAGIEQ